jgi:hypothetical protein
MNPLRIVMVIIKFSLCVGLAGGLVDMTRAMMSKAADAQRVGLVSLTDLNRALFGADIKRRTRLLSGVSN